MDDTFELIAADRRAIAAILDELSDAEWSAPSLCEGWNIRQLAAHLVMTLEMSTPRILLGTATNRGYDRFARRWAISRAATAGSGSELARSLREHADSRFRPPGVSAEGPLTEVVVHGLDLVTPLERRLDGPRDEVHRRVLDFLTSKMATRGYIPKGRVDGLALDCPAISWAHGDGAPVTGPPEALILAIAGRPAGLDQLAGGGVAILAERLSG